MGANQMDRSGFTLIEVMVALVIFSFGALALVGMFTASIGGNAQGRNLTEATILAQSKLDYLLTSEVYGSLTDGSEAGITADGTGTGVLYARSWKITDITTGGTDMKMITVTVSWVTKGFQHYITQSVIRTADK